MIYLFSEQSGVTDQDPGASKINQCRSSITPVARTNHVKVRLTSIYSSLKFKHSRLKMVTRLEAANQKA